MATNLQIATNRRNAPHSTSAYIPDGKLKSAFNGVKHRLNEPPQHKLILKYLARNSEKYGFGKSNDFVMRMTKIQTKRGKPSLPNPSYFQQHAQAQKPIGVENG